MLYQRNNRAFIEGFIGLRKFYALRNYLIVNQREGGVDVHMSYGQTEKVFTIPMDDWNTWFRNINQKLGASNAKAHHFMMYFYIKEKGLLPMIKAKLIEQGIPADHSYVRELV